jgi:hypothetical protein
MGPACAVIDVPYGATLWTGSQKPHYARGGVRGRHLFAERLGAARHGAVARDEAAAAASIGC